MRADLIFVFVKQNIYILLHACTATVRKKKFSILGICGRSSEELEMRTSRREVPMSAASVRPRSAADCLIRSAVDISHPRQQGSPPAERERE